ncbi:MAG: MraY family glycosyltransferase [Alphaproteobacteria bacterium]
MSVVATGLFAAAEGALLVAVLILCMRAEGVGRWLGAVDYPDRHRKLHRAPTPLVGGIAAMVPMLAVAALEGWRQPAHAPLFATLAFATAAFLLLGLADDRRQVSVTARLLLSTLVLTLVIAFLPALALPTLRLDPTGHVVVPLGLLAGPFALVCLLGFQNAVNMADGANGLVIGLAIGWIGLLLLHAPAELQTFLWLFGAALATTLPFNLRGRLFLGDAGSYAVGVLVGAAAIYTYNALPDLPALTVMLWLMLPVVDCLRLIAIRLALGRSPFEPDRDHLHHRLLEALPPGGALAAYLALALLPGFAAEAAPEAAPLLAFSMMLLYLFVLRITSPARRRSA